MSESRKGQEAETLNHSDHAGRGQDSRGVSPHLDAKDIKDVRIARIFAKRLGAELQDGRRHDEDDAGVHQQAADQRGARSHRVQLDKHKVEAHQEVTLHGDD